MPREHPFDRYSVFTDVAALKEWSAKPLRKSVRVNTLKCSIEEFRSWARARAWNIEQVPWCKEGFFVDRPFPSPSPNPAPEREPLGKDLLHLIGGFYMQEAASMLPVTLLDPQPGDTVLDMSAAPGSKTTQIVTRMARVTPSACLPARQVVEGQHAHHASTTFSMTPSGVVIANDIQEHRLWTLKSALHRSGVANAIVTKKVGQWFGKHMTERFDRVLCDAPCTAQGTVRKDSDALNYCGVENIEKMARLQVQLLEAAIHAAKVGGRIVYSTCTLTPEENEGVVMRVLEKFAGKVRVVDPRNAECRMQNAELFDRCVQDSQRVQKFLQNNFQFSIFNSQLPFLRLWPQTYDTEGFFCAVFQKVTPTRGVDRMDDVPFQEDGLSLLQQREVAMKIRELYGTDFCEDGELLFRLGEQLLLASADAAAFRLPMRDYSLGLPLAKVLTNGRVRLSHEIATLRGHRATQARCSLNDEQLALLLEGKDAPGDPALHGDVLLLYEGFCVGRALAKNGVLKNNLPRWMVRYGR